MRLKIISYEPQVTSGCFWCEKDGTKRLIDLLVDGSLEVPMIPEANGQQEVDTFCRSLVGREVEVGYITSCVFTGNKVKLIPDDGVDKIVKK